MIYDKLHDYSIKFEESLFRKDYIMSYLRILISINNYNDAIKVLKKEIDFLMVCEKCKHEGISLYIMDLMIIYMLMNDSEGIKASTALLE